MNQLLQDCLNQVNPDTIAEVRKNMKTIEERALEYANTNPYGNPYNWSAHHDAYIDGAIEQKAIDDEEYRKDMAYLATKRQELIDKACKWLRSKCDYGEEDSSIFLDFNEQEFRKAMEE